MSGPTQGDGSEPIEDDEIVFRRIPVSQNWYDPSLANRLYHAAFKPRRDEHTGISLLRAKYNTLEEAAKGPAKQGYFVGVLRVCDLRSAGIEIVPNPQPGLPGHCEIPSLRSDNRKDDGAIEQMSVLANHLTQNVEGPYAD